MQHTIKIHLYPLSCHDYGQNKTYTCMIQIKNQVNISLIQKITVNLNFKT